MSNYYDILEVSEKASKEVIEKAYKALAKKYHPDLNIDNKKEAEIKMKELNEAYEVLIDDDKRANYDNILNKKREIQRRKEEYSSNSSKNSFASSDSVEKRFEDHNTIAYSKGYYTDKDDNFYVNTANMDEKTRKKLQNQLQERYLEAYDSYLRERGYKLKYKWTFKRFLQTLFIVVLSIAVFTILFFIPPIHEYCLKLYEENVVIRLVVNLFISIFKAIFSIFS